MADSDPSDPYVIDLSKAKYVETFSPFHLPLSANQAPTGQNPSPGTSYLQEVRPWGDL